VIPLSLFESNKNLILKLFQRLLGFIMLKINLQEFNLYFNIQSFVMKKYILRLAYSLTTLLSCSSVKNTDAKLTIKFFMTNDTIRIANDTLEYEVIIIDPGFSTWLASRSFRATITRNLI
jgi:hypothetical protein